MHSFVKILLEKLPVFTAALRVFAQEEGDEKSQARSRSQICAADSHWSFAVTVQNSGEQKSAVSNPDNVLGMHWHL